MTTDFSKVETISDVAALGKAIAAEVGKAVVGQDDVTNMVSIAMLDVVNARISYVTLYQGQPSLGDIDLELRRQGFIPHCFAAVKQLPIAPWVVGGNPRRPFTQLLEADMVYVRDFAHPELMSDEQLKHLALIVHHCYGSHDLALRCVMLLEQRQALEAGAQHSYQQFLAKP